MRAQALGEVVEFAERWASPQFDPRAVAVRHDGWTARGSNYHATEAEGVLRFTPLAETAVAPLELELIEVGRASELVPVETGSPRANGLELAAQVSPGVEQRFRAEERGLYHSLHFEQRPAGEGELVARFEITFKGECSFDEAGRLVLAANGAPSMRVGAVVGIDAAGRRAFGDLRMNGGHLEYVLPASFVERAQFPLVLDPLIESLTPLGTFHLALHEPQLSFDAASQRYLLVACFEPQVATGFAPIRDVDGYLFDAELNAIGSVIPIEWTSDPGLEPRVTNVRGPALFVVRHRQPGIVGTSEYLDAIDPWTGALVQGLAGVGGPAVLGGNRIETDSRFVIPHENAGFDTSLEVDRVVVPPPGVSWHSTAAATNCSHPGATSTLVASRSGGDAGRFAFVTSTPSGSCGGFFDLDAAPFAATFDVPGHVQLSAIDGDGGWFLLAYAATDGALEGRALLLREDGTLVEHPTRRLHPADANVPLDELHVGCAGDRFVVAFSGTDEVTGIDHLIFTIHDPRSGVSTPYDFIDLHSPGLRNLELAMEWASGAESDRGLLVWEAFDADRPIGLHAQRLRAPGGGTYALHGGGCTGGGSLRVSAPMTSEQALLLQLVEADPSATLAFFTTGSGLLPWSCGSCTFNVQYATLDTAPVVGGVARTSLALPPDPSFVPGERFLQAVVLAPTGTFGCPMAPRWAATDVVGVTFGP